MSYSIEERLSDLYLLAQDPEHYDNLPYHNYQDHVLGSINDFRTLCNALEEKDVRIRRAAGEAALLLHDAGYHVDSSEGFDTKEEYSMHIAGSVLNTLGVCEIDIREVQGAIETTDFMKKPSTNLQKAVRVADLGNVYGDNYWDFVKNFLRLQKEAVVMRRPIAETFDEQRRISLEFLGRYVAPITFIAKDGSEVELPKSMNFAERNIAELNKATLDAIRSIPGADKLIPDQWK